MFTYSIKVKKINLFFLFIGSIPIHPRPLVLMIRVVPIMVIMVMDVIPFDVLPERYPIIVIIPAWLIVATPFPSGFLFLFLALLRGIHGHFVHRSRCRGH
jgi:hypothetical protein